jgi:organic radical activating enzyme
MSTFVPATVKDLLRDWNERLREIRSKNPPVPNDHDYIVAEVYMFDTCTHRCGYCWLAESGQVLDFAQLEPFRSTEWIAKVAGFFNKRSAASKWLLQFTGGEPLMAPNLDLLCRSLFEHGNRVAFYTALLLGKNHPGFRFLTQSSAPDVDYVMASLHPEGEQDEDAYFEKIRILKDAGHRLFVRYVGHPKRLENLERVAAKCAALDVCFYPTTLLSNSYPRSYTAEERQQLARYFSSLSQYIQLEGGIATKETLCYAGSKVVGVNLQTGNITPCITVHKPVIGNVFQDELRLKRKAIECPDAGITCVCDIHFQHHIVIGADDRDRFVRQKSGYVPPADLTPALDRLREQGLRYYECAKTGMGDVADESRLFYTIEEVRENYRRRQQMR